MMRMMAVTWLKDMSMKAIKLYVLNPNLPVPPGQADLLNLLLGRDIGISDHF